MVQAANLGFPRLGLNREWKKVSEKYWSGKADRAELLRSADELTARHWALQAQAGVEIIPCNDFAFYDLMLDTSLLVGAVPPRFGALQDGEIDLETYFALARGTKTAVPMEMTKWFDTNYHYLVPEFSKATAFRLASQHPLRAVEQARAAGVAQPRPVLIGPATFLLLGKIVEGGLRKADLVDDLVQVYINMLRRLHQLNVPWVQVDEPVLVTDLSAEGREILQRAYRQITGLAQRPKLLLATYFSGLDDNTDLALSLGAEGLHIDLVRAPEQLDAILKKAGSELTLSLGVVDGRNVWRTDLDRALTLLKKAADRVGADRLQVAPSCSLLHCPMDLEAEKALDPEIREWLAFGKQKLHEVSLLTRAMNEGEAAVEPEFTQSREALRRRRTSAKAVNSAVQARLHSIQPEMERRSSPFAQRLKAQQAHLKLPLLPMTTIGSFPQTDEIRKLRTDQKKGLISAEQMEKALQEAMDGTIRFQEEIGLDVLVHGEFERNDMVEYFGEQMEGYLFTANGWVQSYGSRAVKPPIIFGDLQRRGPMTVKWSQRAQQQTQKPMKGMLTGPVTMLQWSFVRDDQPRRVTCQQLALAVRDEVTDLEKAGIRVLQIDEPALREGMPLRRKQWESYLDWAVRCFRLASSGVKDETQIHTHMCYAEFNEIIETIAALDADVISIEASRSRMELLEAFQRFHYPNDVGPGIYDIHSPRVPSVEEMVDLLHKALQRIPRERLWVNPDCGLKTRHWEEVIPALKNMVAAAAQVREELMGHAS